MSVFVCIPTAREIHGATTGATFRICASHQGGAEFYTVMAQPADHARNLCVRQFLQTKHSHLFFVDSDVVPPDNCLDVMLAARRPIVCGVYPLLVGTATVRTSLATRKPDGTYEFLGVLPNEPFEVDAGGMGCCLIERRVLEQMESPWYRFIPRPDGGLTGEDIYFFERAAELGIKPWVLPKVHCSHIKTIDLLEVIQAIWKARAEQPEPVGV